MSTVEVKGHAAEEDVHAGRATLEDRAGNNLAGEAAGRGQNMHEHGMSSWLTTMITDTGSIE